MIIRMPIVNIRSQSRNTQGVRLMRLKKRNDVLMAVAILRGAELDIEDEEGEFDPDAPIVEAGDADIVDVETEEIELSEETEDAEE